MTALGHTRPFGDVGSMSGLLRTWSGDLWVRPRLARRFPQGVLAATANGETPVTASCGSVHHGLNVQRMALGLFHQEWWSRQRQCVQMAGQRHHGCRKTVSER